LIEIYGVLAYSVAQPRQELGIRMALGAKRADILLLIVRQGLLLAIAGIAIGLIAALLLTRADVEHVVQNRDARSHHIPELVAEEPEQRAGRAFRLEMAL
jgi:ABC-type lipoprotein release transport system permease subunit